MGVCAVPDCGKPLKAKGFCQTHYYRWRTYGDPLTVPEPRKRATCTVPDCGRPAAGRGLCGTHWQRWKTTGDAQADKPLRQLHDSDTCAVKECVKPPESKGYCGPHYMRFVRHGDPLGARVYNVRGQCRIDDCENTAQARGMCKSHWEKWSRHGDPYFEPEVKPKPRSGTCEIDGCDRPVASIGMCSRHVYSHYKYGNPLTSRRRRRYRDEIETVCRIDGCELPHKSVGYCNKHYVTVVRYGYLKRNRAHTILESFMRRLHESPCMWCGRVGDTQADHVIPIMRGGQHCEGNLQPLCGECNRRKNDRLMIEWKWAMLRDAELPPDADFRHLDPPPGRAPRHKRS